MPRKRRYFYGLWLHLVVTAIGEPVELFLLPGADNDTGALQWYQFDLPEGATSVGDKAFNHYCIEDDLAAIGLHLAPLRKKNAKRAIPPWAMYWRQLVRHSIETVGSVLTDRFPKTIRAVSATGFELKTVLFVLAYSIDCLLVATWVTHIWVRVGDVAQRIWQCRCRQRPLPRMRSLHTLYATPNKRPSSWYVPQRCA